MPAADNPALAPRRTCHAAASGTSWVVRVHPQGDHINSCLHHASNWTCAHDHALRALERICNDTGFATTHKRVLSSESNRRADLEIRKIRVAHRFAGGRHPAPQFHRRWSNRAASRLRNPDHHSVVNSNLGSCDGLDSTPRMEVGEFDGDTVGSRKVEAKLEHRQ